MPIYPKVDLCRMLAIMEVKGLQVYADLIVYPMDLEELMSNGTSRLTNYLDKKIILMSPEIGGIVDKIKILDLERDIVFEKYEKIKCALKFSKEREDELKSKMNEFRIERDCIDAKIAEYNEFLKKDKSIEMYLDIQREIKEYLDIDVCKILNEKGFLMAKTVVQYGDEYRIGMFNENSFIMINTENQKAMCGLKKVFHEGAIIILNYVNSGTEAYVNDKNEFFDTQIYTLYDAHLYKAIFDETFSSERIRIERFNSIWKIVIPSSPKDLPTKPIHVVRRSNHG